MRTRAVLFLLCLVALSSESRGATCPVVLNSPGQTISKTDSVISSLKDLYNNGTLSYADLVAVRAGENPLEKKQGVNERTFSDVLDVVIAQMKHSPDLRERLDDLIRQVSGQFQAKKIQAHETATTAIPMTLYHIPKGSFFMGVENDQFEPSHYVKLTSGFFAANIPVTQWQYSMVMNDAVIPNPSTFKGGNGATFIDVGGRKEWMRVNNPVEGLHETEVEAFLKRMNELSQKDDPLIYKIIRNHIRFARIRLLTEAEWEYLARNLGKWELSYPDGITDENLHNFAWIRENSQGSTHPVGELQPLMINGHPFYDLIGNVCVWVQDAYRSKYGLTPDQIGKVTLNPLVKVPGIEKVFRGACWNDTAFAATLGKRDSLTTYFDTPSIGILLAEDLP